jgi:hypothetical protein
VPLGLRSCGSASPRLPHTPILGPASLDGGAIFGGIAPTFTGQRRLAFVIFGTAMVRRPFHRGLDRGAGAERASSAASGRVGVVDAIVTVCTGTSRAAKDAGALAIAPARVPA